MCFAREQDALIERRLASLPIHAQKRRVKWGPEGAHLTGLQ